MSTLYNGLAGNESLHAIFNISSSTNATPIVVQTSAPHDLSEGDEVEIYEHATNTNANGKSFAHVVDGTHISLYGSISSGGLASPRVGSGVGVATGFVRGLGLLPTYAIPSDGDALNASSVNPALEDAGDRTQYIVGTAGTFKLIEHHFRSANTLASGAAPSRYGGAMAGITVLDTTWRRKGLLGPISLDAYSLGVFPNVLSGDIVEAYCNFNFDISDAANGGNVIGGGPMYLGLGYELFEEGTSPVVAVDGAASIIPGSAHLVAAITPNGAGTTSTTLLPIDLRGAISVSVGGAPRYQKLQLYLTARESGASFSGAFWDDFEWLVRIYRPTGLYE